jgi:hypothetical protein
MMMMIIVIVIVIITITKLYKKWAINFLSFGKEINMSITEIERRAGEFYFNTASLIEPVYIEKCNV